MQGRETGLPVPLRDGILGWRGGSAGKGDCYMDLMTPSSNSGTRVKVKERRDATKLPSDHHIHSVASMPPPYIKQSHTYTHRNNLEYLLSN